VWHVAIQAVATRRIDGMVRVLCDAVSKVCMTFQAGTITRQLGLQLVVSPLLKGAARTVVGVAFRGTTGMMVRRAGSMAIRSARCIPGL
jgi:hypothetical protein